ncbi:UNVERIFIED_CONTAM: SH3 and multiple ankyrin repeat domains protein 3 [Gekko kuhli]
MLQLFAVGSRPVACGTQRSRYRRCVQEHAGRRLKAFRFAHAAAQKCLRLNPDVPIWVSKQRILCTLNHSLKDVLNYGLFQPAFNGRAGKFLDEERLLREYPLNPDTPVPYLEFRYKRRVYTQSLLDDKQFAKLHTKGLGEAAVSPDHD